MNIFALKVNGNGLLEPSKIGVVDASCWADTSGRIVTDSGRKTIIKGWGQMDGEVRILVDEFGDDSYYIK